MKDITAFFSSFTIMLSGASYGQRLLLALSAAIWLAGCCGLFAAHYKRTGRPRRMALRPFAFPVGSFNLKEWLALLGLAAASFACAVYALLG